MVLFRNYQNENFIKNHAISCDILSRGEKRIERKLKLTQGGTTYKFLVGRDILVKINEKYEQERKHNTEEIT